MKSFRIHTPYVTITQLLKALDYIGSGGEAKFFLCDHSVKLNDANVTERKRKIRPQDIVDIDGDQYLITHDQEN